MSSNAPQTPDDAEGIAEDLFRDLDHMRPSEAYWHVGRVVDEVRQVLDQAWAFIEAGDGRNALVILEAITWMARS